MHWYAIANAKKSPTEFMSYIPHPLIAEYIARRVLTDPTDKERVLNDLLRSVTLSEDDHFRAATLRGIAEGLRGVNLASVPGRWGPTYELYPKTNSVEVRKQLDELGLIFNDPAVMESLRKRTANAKTPTDDRTRAVALLSARKTRDFVPVLHKALADPAVRTAILATPACDKLSAPSRRTNGSGLCSNSDEVPYQSQATSPRDMVAADVRIIPVF